MRLRLSLEWTALAELLEPLQLPEGKYGKPNMGEYQLCSLRRRLLVPCARSSIVESKAQIAVGVLRGRYTMAQTDWIVLEAHCLVQFFLAIQLDELGSFPFDYLEVCVHDLIARLAADAT